MATGLSSTSSNPSTSARSRRIHRPVRNRRSCCSDVSPVVPRNCPSQIRPSKWSHNSLNATPGSTNSIGQQSAGAPSAKASARSPPSPISSVHPPSPRVSETNASVGSPSAQAFVIRSHTSAPSHSNPPASTCCCIRLALPTSSGMSNGRKRTAPHSDLWNSPSPSPFSTTGSPERNGSGSPSIPWAGVDKPARSSRA